MAYKTVVKSSISKNNIKLTADKVILILDQIREEGKKSKRRWIWELMQNAKDVPNVFNEVSIDIILNQNELVFAHNGNAFTIDNLTGLVQQVSSKHSTNEDKKVTGKFGTGFIATHLLSEIITIDGVLQEPGEIAKKFSFDLDRSGKTSEDLINPIEDALDALNDIDESEKFKSFPEYEAARKEDDYFNKFRYPLNEETYKTAEIGINDLIETLPISLVFLEDIKQVSVKNNVEKTHHIYKVEEPNLEDGEYKELSISILDKLNEDKVAYKNYILKSKKDIELLVEVKDFQSYELISVGDNQPFLYRDFPLIGTEHFYFPFILNGRTFNPTERRDSIYLNGSSFKVEHNKKVLEDSISHSLEFVDYLISKKAKNLFNVCLSSLPNNHFESDDSEDNSKEWYLDSIQKKYRERLIDKEIVRHGDATCALSAIRFPTSSEYDYPELRSLITDYLGDAEVPAPHEQENWIKYLGPENEMKTWGLELSYGLNELVRDIDNLETIEDFKSATEVYSWFNRLYMALEKLDQSGYHSALTLVPNHKGRFKKLSTLFVEQVSDTDNSFLPDPFLELLNSMGEDWYEDLIHRKVEIIKKAHQTRSMSDLNSAINTLFKSENFLNTENALTHLLNVHSITVPNSQEDSFQRSLLSFAKKLFNNNVELISNGFVSKFNFEIAHRLLIQSINKQLEKIGSISSLMNELDLTKDEATTWLNKYLNLLDKKTEDYSKFLKEGKIIPNRESDSVFCYFNEILNYGTEVQPLDDSLLKILSKLNGDKNFFKDIVADGISIKVSETLSFERLGNEVIQEVELIDFHKTFEDNREALLELINWTEIQKDLMRKYASKLEILTGQIFYILTIENSENREDVMKILKNANNIKSIAGIIENNAFVKQIDNLVKLFPNGISERVMLFAKDDAHARKKFNNLLEVGSKVEKLLIKTLAEYNISSEREKIIHAGGGAYDIRIFNPDTEKSFYIELKSCRFNNTDPINIAISQAKRSIKQLEHGNFSIVIIERSQNNEMDEDYIRANTKYLNNPGGHMGPIVENFLMIEKSANTSNLVDLKMDYAEFKGVLDYEWLKKEVGNSGFNDLLTDIKGYLSK